MSWFIRRSSGSAVSRLRRLRNWKKEQMVPKTVKDEGVKDLEKKLEKMMWKMNCFIVVVAIVMFGIVVRSVVMT